MLSLAHPGADTSASAESMLSETRILIEVVMGWWDGVRSVLAAIVCSEVHE